MVAIEKMTVKERLELIERIWDSLPAEMAPEDVPAWHLDELMKRRAVAEAKPGEGKPWREVLAKLETPS